MARKIVVASGKGGVGKTTVSVGISKALSKMGYNVLLVDFDNLRGVDLVANAAEEVVYDWGDVINKRCDPQDALCHTGDITVLASPHSYFGFVELNIKWLMAQYDKFFDFILLDAPAGIGTGLKLACAGARRGIVVSMPDLVCVRGACVAAKEMENYGVSSCRLIINRAVKKDIQKKRLLNIDEVIDSTEVQLIGIVPEDKKIRYCAMEGQVYKKNQVSYQAFTNIAGRIVGKTIPLSII